MGKKKKEEVKQEKASSSPLFLTDTLLTMDEIQQYGLNKYILRAILCDKFYTLEQAHSLIRSKLEGR